MITSSARTIFVASVALALVSVAGTVWFFWFIRQERIATELLRAEVREVADRAATRTQTASLGTDGRAQELRLANLFLSRADVVGIIEHIENLEGITGASVDIKSVDWRAGEKSSTSSTSPEDLVVRFSAEGTWGSVAHSLHLVGALPNVVLVERVHVERDEGAGKQWRGIFDIAFPVPR